MTAKVPVYVISLPRATDRRRHMSRQLDSVGIEYEFVDAVDGGAMMVTDTFDKYSGKLMSPSQIGCAESHRLLYGRVIERGFDGAIILEDDAIISPQFARSVRLIREKCIGSHLSNDLLHFGSLDPEYGYRIIFGKGHGAIPGIFRVAFARRALYGTFGYYVSAELAAAILEAEPKVCALADAWESRIKASVVRAVWIALPSICTHPEDLSDSFILTEKQKTDKLRVKRRRLAKWFQLSRPLYRFAISLMNRMSAVRTELGRGQDLRASARILIRPVPSPQ